LWTSICRLATTTTLSAVGALPATTATLTATITTTAQTVTPLTAITTTATTAATAATTSYGHEHGSPTTASYGRETTAFSPERGRGKRWWVYRELSPFSSET